MDLESFEGKTHPAHANQKIGVIELIMCLTFKSQREQISVSGFIIFSGIMEKTQGIKNLEKVDEI